MHTVIICLNNIFDEIFVEDVRIKLNKLKCRINLAHADLLYLGGLHGIAKFMKLMSEVL